MYTSTSKSFLLVILHLLLLQNSTLAVPLYTNCFDTTNYTSNNLFATNLNLLLRSLSLDAPLNNGFSNATTGKNPDQVYGVALCRGDVSAQVCRNCLQVASKEGIEACHNEKGLLIWYEYCMLRYAANKNSVSIEFPGMVLLYDAQSKFRPNNGTNAGARALLYSLVNKAVSQPLMFAAGADEVGKGYGLVQCSRDLSLERCRRCLVQQMDYAALCCAGKRGWRVLGSSCTIRYEGYRFISSPGPPPTSEPDSPPVPSGKGHDMNPKSKGNKVSAKATILSTVGAILGMAVLVSFVYCYYLCRRKKQQEEKVEISEETMLYDSRSPSSNTTFLQDNSEGMNSMQSQELSLIEMDTIVTATSDLIDEDKLDEG